MNLFLDIEKTLIESMDDQTPTVYFDSIVEYVRKFYKKVYIFSFAIYDHSDMPSHLMRFFQESFQVPITIVPKNDLKEIYRDKFGIKDDLDFFDFSNNKQLAFQLFGMRCAENLAFRAKYDIRSNEICLIDDMVLKSEMIYNRFTILTLRVQDGF